MGSFVPARSTRTTTAAMSIRSGVEVAGVHEVCHAIVMRAMGSGPVRVWVDERGAGAALGTPAERGDWMENFQSTLAIMLAGAVGERLAAGGNPANDQDPRATVRRILSLERGERTGVPLSGSMADMHRHVTSTSPDGWRWAIDILAERFQSETLAYELMGLIGPHEMRRAVEILAARWGDIEEYTARLTAEREIVI